MAIVAEAKTTLDSLNAEERHLLWAVAVGESTSKEGLTQRLGWGNSKLNACLAELKKRHILSVSTLPKDGTGRKPLSFALAPELGYFLGIQCDIDADYFVLIDASGKKAAEARYPALAWEEKAEEELLGNVADFLAKGPPESQGKTLAVGISSAIRFNKRQDGPTHRSPLFTNDAILPLAHSMETRFGIPVAVGRPQVLLCHQADLRELIARKESFINIMSTDNVGIATFLHGESWLGHSGLSGDLGHLKVAGNDLPCYCGASGCLRTKLSYMGICQEAKRRLAEISAGGGKHQLDSPLFNGPDYEAGVSLLVEAANRHDALATGIIYDVATDLGAALATVVSLFNPARLIIHSILTEAHEIFSERVRSMIRKNCLDLYSRSLTIDFRTYSQDRNAMGAAMFGRDEYIKNVLGIR